MNITPKQLRIVQFITDFTATNRYSPTLQEIAEHVGVSKITVLDHLRALERRGIIRRQRYLSRSIECLVDVNQPETIPPNGRLNLQLMGRITAGAPLEAMEHKESVDLAGMVTRNKDCFLLEVRGNSMIEDHIQDGDYVVVEPRQSASDGETVVALLPTGETTLKKLYRQGARFRLQPANGTMAPLIVDEVKVQGVVVGIVRKY